jgi:2'-hydroxyisoflavone reductase
MKLLILGGTAFLGRHLATVAQQRGHHLTLFHRGRSHPELFDDALKLYGNRVDDLEALRHGRWDAVIDTCGYTPGIVRRSAELLAGAVQHYTFISSVSAYSSYPAEGLDETAPVATLSAQQVKEAEKIAASAPLGTLSFGAMYGGLKARCEEAAETALPGRVLHVRPGLIVGPHDFSGRFAYWVRRVAQGGEVLAPGQSEQPIRLIDVRDLAEWILDRVEARTVGTLNAVGAVGPTLGGLLDECRAASGSDATFTWVPEDFLLAREVRPWLELPLWLPEGQRGFFAVRDDKAIAAGLRFRPLAQTVGDTLAWIRSSGSIESWQAVGLAAPREAQLLDQLREI